MRFNPGIAARPAAAGGPPAPTGVWSPTTNLGSDLVMWWNADDLTAGGVASWPDRQIAGALTAAGSDRPTLGPLAFLGTKKGVSFAGSPEHLTQEPVPAAVPVGNTPGEIWSVAVWTSGLYLFRYGNQAAVSCDRNIQQYSGVWRVTDNTVNCDDTVVTPTSGAAVILGGWFSSTQLGGRINGAEFSGGTKAATPNTTTDRIRMGASGGTGDAGHMICVVRHAMITKLLPVYTRMQLEGWFAHDCGITASLIAGHPYKTLAP